MFEYLQILSEHVDGSNFIIPIGEMPVGINDSNMSKNYLFLSPNQSYVKITGQKGF